MKTIFKNTVLACGFLMLTSCSDYLDVAMTESVNPKTFYKTEAQVDQAIVGMYNTISTIPKHRWFLSEVRSDNVWMEKESVSGASEICYFLNSDLVSNGQVEAAWEDYYSMIANANAILDNIGNASFSSEDIRSEYIGEARFIRALAYFDLVRFFGNIPVSTISLSPEQSLNVKQATSQQVYEQVIIPDLEYASENLKETFVRYDNKTAEAVGRVTQMAAKALLAEVYVTMAGFPLLDESKKDLALPLLKEVIDYSAANSNKWWAADIDTWNKMWIHENDNKYYIFEIQADIDATTSQGSTITPYTVDRSWNSNGIYGGKNTQTNGHSYGYPFVEPGLRNYFITKNADGEYADKRCFNTITVKNASGGSLVDNECYFMKFWENKLKRETFGYSDMSASMLNKISTWPQNFPVIRLENIMLYYAELAGMDEGLPYLNKIHQRATGGSYQANDFASEDEYQEAVLNERRYELASEGQRWFDLVRLNKWQETLKQMFLTNGPETTNQLLEGYAENVLPFTYLYPIPQAQMEVKDGLYDQNLGYDK